MREIHVFTEIYPDSIYDGVGGGGGATLASTESNAGSHYTRLFKSVLLQESNIRVIKEVILHTVMKVVTDKIKAEINVYVGDNSVRMTVEHFLRIVSTD